MDAAAEEEEVVGGVEEAGELLALFGEGEAIAAAAVGTRVSWLKGAGSCGGTGGIGVLRLRPVRLACCSLRGSGRDDTNS